MGGAKLAHKRNAKLNRILQISIGVSKDQLKFQCQSRINKRTQGIILENIIEKQLVQPNKFI